MGVVVTARLHGSGAPPAREVFDEADRQRGPAGLVARADAAAGLAVEVLVEQHQPAPVRILGEASFAGVAGTVPALARQKDAGQASRDLARSLADGDEAARAGRALDAQIVAVEVVIALERLDEQVVDRHPDRP